MRSFMSYKVAALAAVAVVAILIPGQSLAVRNHASAVPTASSGWKVTVFADNFQSVSGEGPIGLTFDAGTATTANLYVGDIEDGKIYKFPISCSTSTCHSNTASSVTPGFSADGLTGLAFTNNQLYAADQQGTLYSVSSDGTKTSVASVPSPNGLAAVPYCIGGCLVSSSQSSNKLTVTHLSPVSTTSYTTSFPKYGDGVVVDTNHNAYVEHGYQYISQFSPGGVENVDTIGSGNCKPSIPGADGMALITDSTGTPTHMAVNDNHGNLTLIDLSTCAQTPMFTGGTRGDFVTVGPDGCIYATQTDTVVRVTRDDGTCGFAQVPPSGLTIKKSVVSQKGNTVTFKVSYMNNNPYPVYGAKIVDVLPGASTLTPLNGSNFAPAGTGCFPSGVSAGVLTIHLRNPAGSSCTLGGIAAGASGAVTFTITMPSSLHGLELCNCANFAYRLNPKATGTTNSAHDCVDYLFTGRGTGSGITPARR